MPIAITDQMRATAPVSFIESDKHTYEPEDGMALCLSGGGYRAMLFHVGALIRLNDAGILKNLRRISSVSGGSITAAVLGLKWRRLGFGDNGVAASLMQDIVEPIRNLASQTIDVCSVLKGLLLPGRISDKIAAAYDRYLFDGATLQDLPSDKDGPRFVFNATNVQSGALWRFSKPYMADYLVGMILNPKVPLAVAVAASSAFPPFLSPTRLDLNPDEIVRDATYPLQKEPFTRQAILTDGGIYDNLGLETAWKRCKTVLASDGGGKLDSDGSPARDWARHSYRILNLIDNQVRSLRKRRLIESFMAQSGSAMRNGAYWGIRVQIGNYNLPDALPCPEDRTQELANTPTRLAKIEPVRQEQLINWGYAACDAALRKHVDSSLKRPNGFPYPESAV